MEPNMHVMIFEPRYKGHHLYYVRLLIPALLEMGCRVSLATGPDVTRSDEYAVQIKPFGDEIAVFDRAEAAEGAAHPLGVFLRQLRAAVRELRPEHMLIPSADGIVQQLGIARLRGGAGFMKGCELEAMLLRCRFAMKGLSWRDRIKTWAIRRAIQVAPVSRLYTIDALALERLRKDGSALGRRMQLMPDPLDEVGDAPTQTGARRMLGIPEGGRYIGIAGVLDIRKGIDKLLAAFQAAHLKEDDRVLLAGRADRFVEELVRGRFAGLISSGRVMLINRVLSDEELVAAVAAMDVVCTPYLGHVGPSAMVMRAAVMGRPILASDYGWVHETVVRLKLGWTCDVRDKDAFAKKIETALERDAGVSDRPPLEQLRKYLSPENFVATWLGRIRERMGLPKKAVVEWKTVESG